MIERIITKKLPFNADVHLPQKKSFKHNNNLYSVEYRRNSVDESLFITIKDVENDEILLSTRVVLNGVYEVKSGDGIIEFALIPKELVKDIDIRIVDSDVVMKRVNE